MSGLRPDTTDRLADALNAHVEQHGLRGAVALVARGDDEAVAVISGADTMSRDSVFRIASITKPIVAAAAMVLIERRVLRLDDPVDDLLPELADRQVLRSLDGTEADPADRPISVRDLLTSRMGLGSIMAPPGTYPIQDEITRLHIGGDGPPRLSEWPATDEWMRGLGSLPLIAQPGATWMYNVPLDVLGVLVGRAGGGTLGEVLRELILAPLGMTETGFHVRPDQAGRLTTLYSRGPDGEQSVFDPAGGSTFLAPPAFESGSGGLVSTIDDYAAFARMLLAGGRHGTYRLLSRASVALMTANQLTPAQMAGAGFFLDGGGWGFGMGVVTERRQLWQTPGMFGWEGGFGTSARVDPVEGLIGILMTQQMMDSPQSPALYSDFWTTAYTSLAD